MSIKTNEGVDDEAWPEMVALAANLRRLRLKNGWTQDQVAEATGTSQGYVSAMENNQVNPGAQMIITLARLFEVSPGRLFDVPPPRWSNGGSEKRPRGRPPKGLLGQR